MSLNKTKQKITADSMLHAKLPSNISDYLKKYFGDSIPSMIKPIKNMKGEIFFDVDIIHDNTMYHLKFNRRGVLVEKLSEPIYELYNDEVFEIED